MKWSTTTLTLLVCLGWVSPASAQFGAARDGLTQVRNQRGKIRSDQPFDTSKSVAKEVAAGCQRIERALANCGKTLTDDRKSNVQRAVAVAKGQAEVTRSATITWNTNLERGNSLKTDADLVAKQVEELLEQFENLEEAVEAHRRHLHDQFKTWHGKRLGLLNRAKALKSQEESLEKQLASQWKELESAYGALKSAQDANQQAADAEDDAFQKWQEESAKEKAEEGRVSSLANAWNSAYERSKSARARASEASKKADALDARYDATLKKWSENQSDLKEFFGASDLVKANEGFFQFREHVLNFEKEFPK